MENTTTTTRMVRCRACGALLGERTPDGIETRRRGRVVAVVASGSIRCRRCDMDLLFRDAEPVAVAVLRVASSPPHG